MKRILLVEDREDDVVLFQLAIRQAIPHTLEVKADGVELINHLEQWQTGRNTETGGLPDLILLDINMPRLNGFEVLRWIRQQLPLVTVPVVMLTTSSNRDDIVKAMGLGANSFLTKSADMTEFRKTLELALKYWLEAHQPPVVRPPKIQ